MIKINSFRGCESFTANPGAYILSGRNGAGKSSIIEGAALPALCEFGKPGAIKADTNLTIKDGFQESVLECGENKVSLPDCKISGKPMCDLFTAGFQDFTQQKPADVVRTLTMFACEITKEDLKSELPHLPDITRDEIFETIQKHGIEKAFESYKASGAKLKGRWEQATGQKKYGSKVAQTFVPDGWYIGLDSISDAELEAQIRELNEAKSGLLMDVGADVARQEQAERFNTDLLAKEKRITLIDSQLDKIKTDLKTLELKQKQVKSSTHTCPNCGSALVIKELEISKADGDNSGEIKRLISLAERLTEEKTEISKFISENKPIIVQPAAIPDTESIDKQIKEIEISLNAKRIKSDADKLRKQICDHVDIVKALDQTGIRAKKIGSMVGELNVLFSIIYADAKMSMTESGYFRAFGRPLVSLSKGEQYVCESVFKIAWALKNGHKFLALDMADRITDKHFEAIKSTVLRIKKRIAYILIGRATESDLLVEEI